MASTDVAEIIATAERAKSNEELKQLADDIPSECVISLYVPIIGAAYAHLEAGNRRRFLRLMTLGHRMMGHGILLDTILNSPDFRF